MEMQSRRNSRWWQSRPKRLTALAPLTRHLMWKNHHTARALEIVKPALLFAGRPCDPNRRPAIRGKVKKRSVKNKKANRKKTNFQIQTFYIPFSEILTIASSSCCRTDRKDLVRKCCGLQNPYTISKVLDYFQWTFLRSKPIWVIKASCRFCSWTYSFHAFKPKASQQQDFLTMISISHLCHQKKKIKSSSNLHGVRGVRHLILSWHLSEKLTMRKSDSPQKAFDFRKMTGDTTQISSAVVNQKPDWKGTRYCFWHHYWNNLNSWWSSRGVQIWFLLNVGAGKDLSRNQIPAYAFDLKCPHDWPYGSDFFSSCEPKPNFEKNEMQIWQTNHPNHAKSSSTYRGVRHLSTLSAWTRSEEELGFPKTIWPFKTPHDLLREFDFQLKVFHHKPFRKGIGWTYWMKLYEMHVIMDCVAGSVRSAFGPCPGPGWSEDGHTLGF